MKVKSKTSNMIKKAAAYVYEVVAFIFISYYFSLFLFLSGYSSLTLHTFIFVVSSDIIFELINKYIIKQAISMSFLKHINYLLIVNHIAILLSWLAWIHHI